MARRLKNLLPVFSFAFLLFVLLHVETQEVERVEKGSVEVNKEGDQTTIQASDGSIIRYSSFDISAGETLQFIQPNRSAKVLNRIRSGSPSHINGNLFANGQVYLTNPAGVIFGNNAMVDVAQLYASAGRISNEDFRNGINRFTDLSGEVENLGEIHGSEVHLLGQQVVNTGSIVAEDGIITMSAGEQVLIGKRTGSTFARVETAGNTQEVSGVGVKNEGRLQAGNGEITVGAGDTYSVAIRSTGDILANNVSVDGGTAGQVQLSGSISAAGRQTGERGGNIEITGDELVLSDFTADASGKSGGGTINVGGSAHGDGPLQNASHTLVNSDSTLTADATESGDGGKVVVWADESTTMHGQVSARGGTKGGDGGFVEISGGDLDTSISNVDVTAPKGESGTTLFDPAKIEIRGSGSTFSDGDDQNDTSGEVFLDERTGGPYEINFGNGATGDDGSGTGGEPFVVYEKELENVAPGSTVLLEATDQISTSTTGPDFGDDTFNEVPDVLLPLDVDVILRTRNNTEDRVGGIDLTSNGDLSFLEFVTQGSGSIFLKGSTSGAREANIQIPRLLSDEKVDVTTRNGNITLDANGQIEAPGNISLKAEGSHNIELNNQVLSGGGSIDLETGDEGTVSIGGDSGGNLDADQQIGIRSDNLSVSVFSSLSANRISISPEIVEDAGDDIRIENTTSGSDELVITPNELSSFSAPLVEIGDPDAGQFDVVDGFTQNFNLRFGSGGAVTVGASIDSNTHYLTIRSLSDVRLKNSGTQLTAEGTGNDIKIESREDFVNDVGKNVLSTTNGARWIIYSLAPERAQDGNLLEKADFEEYAVTFPEDPVGKGSGFYYGVREEENLTTDISDSKLLLDEDETDPAGEMVLLTERETGRLLDTYGSDEVGESLTDVDLMADELDEILEEPTRELVERSTPDLRLQGNEEEIDDAQELVGVSLEQKRNFQAQAREYEKQGDADRATDKQQQAQEQDEKLSEAKQKLQTIRQGTIPTGVNESVRRQVRGEALMVRQSIQTMDMERYRNRNQVLTMDVNTGADPSDISAVDLKDSLAADLRERLENQPQGTAHPATPGTLSKLEEKDPIKGVGGSHIRSVSVSGTKAVPEQNDQLQEYYKELSNKVAEWNEENTLRFQIMGGGSENDWGFGMINIFLNRETGVYLMRSNIDLLENASEKSEGTDFGSFVQQEKLEELEGDHTSLTISGQVQ